jgi:hypothetical protein
LRSTTYTFPNESSAILDGSSNCLSSWPGFPHFRYNCSIAVKLLYSSVTPACYVSLWTDELVIIQACGNPKTWTSDLIILSYKTNGSAYPSRPVTKRIFNGCLQNRFKPYLVIGTVSPLIFDSCHIIRSTMPEKSNSYYRIIINILYIY